MTFLLVGSIIAACAPNFSVLLVGRMIQAAGAGIIVPLMMTIMVYLYPAEKRGAIMGKMGFAIMFAPAIAPTVGGFILQFYSWRYLFIIMIPIAAVIIIVALKYMMNVEEGTKISLDIVSVLYSTIGFGAVLYGFSSAGTRGWGDWLVGTAIVAGIVFIALFSRRMLAQKEPLLNLDVFRYKMFTITSVMNIAITVLMYADLILLPIYLQDGRGFNAFYAGLILLPAAIINAFLSPVTGKLFDRFGAKPLFFTGAVLIAVSMVMVIDLTETTSVLYIILRTIVLRVGLACITMPLNTAALNALPRELASHGSAVNNTVRQLAGAIGTAVIVSIYSLQLRHVEETTAGFAAAASNTYMWMFVLAILTIIVTFFVPKKSDSVTS